MNIREDLYEIYENILINEVVRAINYWLDPYGNLIKVDYHIQYAINNFDVEWDENEHTVYTRVYNKGYIRIVENSDTIYFTYNLSKKPNREQFMALYDLAEDKNKNLVDGVTSKIIIKNNEIEPDIASNEKVKELDYDMQPSFYKKNKNRYYEGVNKFSINDYTKLIYENDELETVGLRGEYWFDETGTPIYADGDIGDIGHEGIVIRDMAGSLASDFNLHDDEPYFDYKSPLEQEILSIISNDEDYIRARFNISNDENIDFDVEEELKNDPADEIIKYLVYQGESQEDASDKVLIAYGSSRDARKYAIEKWNWKRVQGDSIESKALTREDLKIISRGINSALSEEGLDYEYEDNPDVLELHEYDVSTYSGKRYSITLRDMESGNVEGLERADIEIPTSSATSQLRNMDIESMPDFYKSKNIIGDSYSNRFMLDDYTKLIT